LEGETIEAERLTPAELERVVSLLEPLLTLRRLERIEAALATRSREVVLVLEDIANEHNGAAVLRTAEAFGFFEVHVVEPMAGRFKISQKISKGAHKWLHLVRHSRTADAYGALKGRGYRIYASTLHGDAVELGQLPADGPIALVFGNELLGLSPKAIANADGYFRIPMGGFVESFNISVAAAISCYDQWSRRRAAGGPRPLSTEEQQQVRAAWLVQAVKSAPQILSRAGSPVPVLHRHAFAQVPEGDGAVE
jgi:tRNA (guanosine-2'-O-)-methyltransferase